MKAEPGDDTVAFIEHEHRGANTVSIVKAIRGRHLAVLLTGLLLLSLPGAGAVAQQPPPGGQEIYQVQGEGVAGFRTGDPTRSREEALEAAQRDAVEKVSGVIIESESQMRNFSLVKDEVLSRSKGFIKTYKVVKEGRDRDLYKVLIDALVVKAAFIKDIDASLEDLYRRVGKPRILVVVRERQMAEEGEEKEGAGTKQRIAEKEIRKILIKQGFTFVDARAAAGANLLEVALKGQEILRDQVISAARTAQAEVIIVGNATTQDKGAFSSFFVAQADLSLDVIRVDNGQVIASEVISAKGLDINQNSAGIKAVQKAAADITPKMMEQVTYVWLKDRSEGGRIELVVKNASFGDLLAFKQALTRNVGGVKQVRQRSFKKGVALFELQTRKSAEQIAESLFKVKFQKFSLDIEDVSAKALTVSLRKP
jgi:hypothetical protein